MAKSRLPDGVAVAVGALWVARQPAGLHMSKCLPPRKGRRTASAVRALWRADPGRTRGRPLSWGQKRVTAPHEPPGEGAKHVGQDAQRQRREGPPPRRG
jgi:hypothetical protein